MKLFWALASLAAGSWLLSTQLGAAIGAGVFLLNFGMVLVMRRNRK